MLKSQYINFLFELCHIFRFPTFSCENSDGVKALLSKFSNDI